MVVVFRVSSVGECFCKNINSNDGGVCHTLPFTISIPRARKALRLYVSLASCHADQRRYLSCQTPSIAHDVHVVRPPNNVACYPASALRPKDADRRPVPTFLWCCVTLRAYRNCSATVACRFWANRPTCCGLRSPTCSSMPCTMAQARGRG